MRIHVKDMANCLENSEAFVDIDVREELSHILTHISMKERIDPLAYDLFFQNARIVQNKCALDYGIAENDTVVIKKKAPSCCILF